MEYTADGNLLMTNSLDERTIHPFTIGHKNWLFSNSVKGAEVTACTYSIIETAKANNLDPYKYLSYIFEYLPGQDIKDTRIIDIFIPWDDEV